MGFAPTASRDAGMRIALKGDMTMKSKNGSTPSDAPKARPSRPAKAKRPPKVTAPEAGGGRKSRPGSGAGGTLRGEKGPSAGKISQRAHEIFVQRGGTHGRDFDDWVEAERQLREESQEDHD